MIAITVPAPRMADVRAGLLWVRERDFPDLLERVADLAAPTPS